MSPNFLVWESSCFWSEQYLVLSTRFGERDCASILGAVRGISSRAKQLPESDEVSHDVLQWDFLKRGNVASAEEDTTPTTEDIEPWRRVFWVRVLIIQEQLGEPQG